MHAHVDASIATADLAGLGAVFAATRSLHEAAQATKRMDLTTVWGVGCHPSLVGAQRHFNLAEFSALIERTAYVSEVGLDGTSSVSLDDQKRTLCAVLRVLQEHPRIISLHSYEASEEVLACLEALPAPGAVLHWWLGDEDQTRRAVGLGCYFSINASSAWRTDLLSVIPLERVLTETDHPFGDRKSAGRRTPGGVGDVEAALARHYDLAPDHLRVAMWRNLGALVQEVGCGSLLPRGIRTRLASV